MALKDLLPPETHIPAATTIREKLKEMGFSVVKALNKAFIHPRNQAKRLEFSNFALDKGIGWMDTIVWSDETMVRSLPQGKQVRFWMRKRRDRLMDSSRGWYHGHVPGMLQRFGYWASCGY